MSGNVTQQELVDLLKFFIPKATENGDNITLTIQGQSISYTKPINGTLRTTRNVRY